ncbi:MAG: hypothetical protein OEZ06_13470 [Myxococcales bacterium]|nr:hypothetical protein [Myxococcales bacterium]
MSKNTCLRLRLIRSFGPLLLSTLLLLCFTEAAQARGGGGGNKIDGVRPEVHLDLGVFHGGFGVGFRIDIPIVPDGLIDGTDDELALSPGLDLFFWDYSRRNYCYINNRGNRVCVDGRYNDGVGFWIPVPVQWNFYLNEHWSIFPELGLGLIWDEYYGDRDGRMRLRPMLSFGARYHFNNRNALLMRLSWPMGFQIGITF